MMSAQQKPGEFDLISRHFAPLSAGEPGAFGLTDDAAVLDWAGGGLVVTTDSMVLGVHFPKETSPEAVAAKLLAVNLSDLAAMGARPVAYLLSAALPQDFKESWVARFCRSLGMEQKRFGVTLVGGDTVSTPGPLTLTLTALGRSSKKGLLRRSGASPGDRIWVSGAIGDAALGLLVLNAELPTAGLDQADLRRLVGRLERPTPRLELGRRLAETSLASAATDISDGLLADIGHICKASGVGARVEAAATPLSDAARRLLAAEPGLSERVLSGGDDYELAFTIPSGREKEVAALSAELDLPLCSVGAITASADVVLIDANGKEGLVRGGGFQHF